MLKKVEQQWDLDKVFPGGAESPQLAAFLKELDADLNRTFQQLQTMDQPHTSEEISAVIEMIDAVGQLEERAEEALAFLTCLTRQNTADEKATAIQRSCTKLPARLNSLYIEVDRLLVQVPALDETQVGAAAFYLQERRKQAENGLSPELETLIGELIGKGAKSWTQVRSHLLGRVSFPLQMEGAEKTLTGRQVVGLLFTSHPEASVRKTIPVKLREAIAPNRDLFALALNQITNAYVQTDRLRGYDGLLQKTLRENRLSEATLEAMGGALERNLARFVPYFAKKAQLLGLETLGEEDLLAPLGTSTSVIPYEEALQTIIEQYGRFSPKMADFVVHASNNNWLDTEDRPNKAFMEYCGLLPVSQSPRVFTRFKGTFHSVVTLAHELGHAYHYFGLAKQPPLARKVPISLAETASTFSEMVVTNGVLERIGRGEERVVLLDEKIKNTIQYVLKPYVNFLFQKRLYAACQNGDTLTADQLDDLMTELQKYVYQDALGTHTPENWITNNLFYLTDRPVYNYQYAFGYMFSAGLYALAMDKGEMSAEQYDDFLQDTGCMTVEDLARKHLGVDLADPDFWQHSMDLLLRGVEEFVTLTAE